MAGCLVASRWAIVDIRLRRSVGGDPDGQGRRFRASRQPCPPILGRHDLEPTVWCAQVGLCMDALHRLSRHGIRAPPSLELIDIVRGSRCMVVVLRAGYPEVLDACGRVLDGATCLLPEESLCRTPVA